MDLPVLELDHQVMEGAIVGGARCMEDRAEMALVFGKESCNIYCPSGGLSTLCWLPQFRVDRLVQEGKDLFHNLLHKARHLVDLLTEMLERDKSVVSQRLSQSSPQCVLRLQAAAEAMCFLCTRAQIIKDQIIHGIVVRKQGTTRVQVLG